MSRIKTLHLDYLHCMQLSPLLLSHAETTQRLPLAETIAHLGATLIILVSGLTKLCSPIRTFQTTGVIKHLSPQSLLSLEKFLRFVSKSQNRLICIPIHWSKPHRGGLNQVQTAYCNHKLWFSSTFYISVTRVEVSKVKFATLAFKSFVVFSWSAKLVDVFFFW